MRSPTLVLCCLVSTAALVVALIGRTGQSSDEHRGDRPNAPSPNLEERMTRLEQAVQALQNDRATRGHQESEAIAASPVAGDATVEDRLTALEESFSSWAESQLGEKPELSHRDLQRMRWALEAVQREEMGDQIVRWVEKERKQSKSVVAAIGERLDLDLGEQQAIVRIFDDENNAHGTMLEELWDAEPPTSESEKKDLAIHWDHTVSRMKELRTERDQKLRELLGPDRYQKFQRIAKEPRQPRRLNRSQR